ncbi:MAG TPA: Gfo/Idh/MocA family oxidoreductase [Bryobacteraceae bacterium]|jgi:predicted dehydrogenase|nr:Gfo/Idh/MocA family oxidoreductase [Bryobacteraceae bacterium]
MLNIAVVGLGFMGVTHLKGWRTVPGVRLHAVVDADERRLTGDLTSVGGNFANTGEKFDFSDVRGYKTLAEALADPAIDAVDICLPTDHHVPAASAALRAGKHVLTEKPISLDVASAESLIREAEQNNRILMAAHVLRFFPSYVKLAELLPDAGAVRSALFRRRCAAPTWNPWLTDPKRSGGGIMDLLIHDADLCISLWGMPEAVRARGARDLPRGIDIIHADLIYPKLGPVVITGGWHHPGAYPFSMEFTVTADAATFEWSSAAGEFRRCRENGEGDTLPLSDRDAFAAELEYFAACVGKKVQPERCPPRQSAQAVALIGRMLESREKNGAVI